MVSNDNLDCYLPVPHTSLIVHLGHLPSNLDDPSAKIWAIYVAEAEKYDKAVTQGWRDDMDGILIFVSLDQFLRSMLI